MKKYHTTRLALTILVMLTILIAWHNWGDLLSATPPPAAVDHSPATLQRGAYLARAGNCIACHTTRGGVALSGGRAIETPFGTVYSSNLTPDPETGLGRWSTQDFWHALHHGRSRNGHLLTPAFPYEHTSLITREDSDTLFAWLQSQPAAQRAQTPHTLIWPLGTQTALAIWRTLFFHPKDWRADPRQSPEWNRGAYLVQGLGHCAACHSPRNALGASAGVANLSGNLMPVLQWYAPDLNSEHESGLVHTPLTETVRLLQTGQNAQASISGPMSEVVQHSLQHLSTSDLQAMALYLRTQAHAQPEASSAPPLAAEGLRHQGRQLYQQHCATCHGTQGEGASSIYPALRGNRAVLLDEPANLINTVLHGGYPPVTAGNPRPFGMPPFGMILSNTEIAAMLTYLRQDLQAQDQRATEVTLQHIHRIRPDGGR